MHKVLIYMYTFVCSVKAEAAADIYSALMCLKHLGGGGESRLERALFTFRLKLPHLSVREPKGTLFICSLCPVKPVHIKLERPRPPYDGLGPAPVNRTCGLGTYS